MPYHPTIRAGHVGPFGFPSVPGLLEAVVTTEVTSPGMPALVLGVRQPRRPVQRIRRAGRLLRSLATGGVKYWSFQSWALDMFTGMSLDPSPLQRALDYGRQQFGLIGGFKRGIRP